MAKLGHLCIDRIIKCVKRNGEDFDESVDILPIPGDLKATIVDTEFVHFMRHYEPAHRDCPKLKFPPDFYYDSGKVPKLSEICGDKIIKSLSVESTYVQEQIVMLPLPSPVKVGLGVQRQGYLDEAEREHSYALEA